MMKPITIAAVIIDYLTAERTHRFVNDLVDGSNMPIECVTVVDNSCDESNTCLLVELFSAEKMTAITNEHVKCLYQSRVGNTTVLVAQSTENMGFAKGNNLGEKLAQQIANYDYIVFSNNDISFPNGLNLFALIEDFQETCIGLVGPGVYGLDEKQQSPCRFIPFTEACINHFFLWPINKLWEKRVPEIIETNDKQVVYRIIGAFMVFSKESFNTIKGFDEHTFLYSEELIVAERLLSEGFRTLYDPSVSIVHEGGVTLEGKTTISRFKFQSNEMFKSKLYYYETYKKVPKLSIGFAKLVYNIYMLKKMISFFLFGK